MIYKVDITITNPLGEVITLSNLNPDAARDIINTLATRVPYGLVFKSIHYWKRNDHCFRKRSQ